MSSLAAFLVGHSPRRGAVAVTAAAPERSATTCEASCLCRVVLERTRGGHLLLASDAEKLRPDASEYFLRGLPAGIERRPTRRPRPERVGDERALVVNAAAAATMTIARGLATGFLLGFVGVTLFIRLTSQPEAIVTVVPAATSVGCALSQSTSPPIPLQ